MRLTNFNYSLFVKAIQLTISLYLMFWYLVYYIWYPCLIIFFIKKNCIHAWSLSYLYPCFSIHYSLPMSSMYAIGDLYTLGLAISRTCTVLLYFFIKSQALWFLQHKVLQNGLLTMYFDEPHAVVVLCLTQRGIWLVLTQQFLHRQVSLLHFWKLC